MRQTALRRLRPKGRSETGLFETVKSSTGAKVVVAVARIVAASARCRADFIGRRWHATSAGEKVWRRGGCRSLDQGRIGESHPKLQGARDERRRVDGEISRSEERRVAKECRSRWSPYH